MGNFTRESSNANVSEMCAFVKTCSEKRSADHPIGSLLILLQVKVLASGAAKTLDSSRQSRLHWGLFAVFTIGVRLED